MKKRVERIQKLFKDRFGKDLAEHELYGNLFPRLIKQMDDFLHNEISDGETIQLTNFLSEKLHGKSILAEKEKPASPNNIKDLDDSREQKLPLKKKNVKT